MQYIIFIFFFIITIAPIIKVKKLSQISRVFLLVYALWWLGTAFVGFFCFNNLYDFQTSSLLITLTSIAVFVFSFIVFFNKVYRTSKVCSEKLNHKVIFSIILIILIIAFSYYLIKYRYLLNLHGISESRNIKFMVGYLFDTQIEAYIYNNIFYPLLIFFIGIIPINIKNDGFRNLNNILTVIAMVLFSLVGNGRLIYFESIFIIFMTGLLLLHDNIINVIKRYFKYILLCFIVVFIVMLLLSASRFGISDIERIPYLINHSVEQFFQYVGYPFRAFDKFIVNDYRNIVIGEAGITFGRVTISGLDVLILKPLSYIGVDLVNINSVFGNLIQEGVSIGYRINMNAYFTSLANFFTDFGYIGCILIPAILGAISSKGINYVEKTKSEFFTVLVGMNLAFFCLGSIRWVYTYTPYWILLIFIIALKIYSDIKLKGFKCVLKSYLQTLRSSVKRLLYSNITYSIRYPFSKNKFEGNNIVFRKTKLKRCCIGFGTYFGHNNSFYDAKFGKLCSIGSNINMATGQHPLHKFVSTHPSFFSSKEQAGFSFVSDDIFQELYEEKLEIGNDVWIGDNVIFTKNVKIGNGAVIGAGSIVTKDVPPYSIVAGNPAKIINYRFSEEEIKKLVSIDWFQWSFEELDKRCDDFTNIEVFIKNNFRKDR